MDRIGEIPLLFWLGAIDITSVTRYTIFLASIALSLTSLLTQTLRGARRPCEEAGPYSNSIAVQGDSIREQLMYFSCNIF